MQHTVMSCLVAWSSSRQVVLQTKLLHLLELPLLLFSLTLCSEPVASCNKRHRANWARAISNANCAERSAYDCTLEMVARAPGLCTLTATSWPLLFSLALYTCAKEAAATGRSPNSENTALMDCPSSRSTVALASVVGKVGMLSCSFDSSVMTLGGSTSGLHSKRTSARFQPCRWLPDYQH